MENEGIFPGVPIEAQQHFERASRYDEEEDFQQALEECEKTLELAPAWAEAHNLRGILLEELGRTEEALQAYAEAVLLDPSFIEAKENLVDAEAEYIKKYRETRGDTPGRLETAKLVTIATFSYPIQAHLAKTRLEWERIECFIADEHIVTVNWLYSTAVGGVKLRVRESDREIALDILRLARIAFEEIDQNGDDSRCPQCNSSDIHYELFATRLVFASWLLLGFPIPFLRREWRCRKCGHRWKAG